jgi:hypothetical protein
MIAAQVNSSWLCSAVTSRPASPLESQAVSFAACVTDSCLVPAGTACAMGQQQQQMQQQFVQVAATVARRSGQLMSLKTACNKALASHQSCYLMTPLVTTTHRQKQWQQQQHMDMPFFPAARNVTCLNPKPPSKLCPIRSPKRTTLFRVYVPCLFRLLKVTVTVTVIALAKPSNPQGLP